MLRNIKVKTVKYIKKEEKIKFNKRYDIIL